MCEKNCLKKMKNKEKEIYNLKYDTVHVINLNKHKLLNKLECQVNKLFNKWNSSTHK